MKRKIDPNLDENEQDEFEDLGCVDNWFTSMQFCGYSPLGVLALFLGFGLRHSPGVRSETDNI